jgi:transposase
MGRFVEGKDRRQAAFLPECLDDYVAPDNLVRVIDAFVDELDLVSLGFERAQPAATGRPAYHPAMMLKLYVYGYLNRVPSSRRLEREAARNTELMWLTGKLAPDFKTIAEFRRVNADGIRAACRQYVVLCRELGLLGARVVAVDGSKFKAVNKRDRNFTRAKLAHSLAETDATIARYLAELDQADVAEGGEPSARIAQLSERIAKLREHMQKLRDIEQELEAAPGGQVSLTDPDSRSMATSGRGSGIVGYNVQAAVEAEHHLIVAHEVTNVGHDRAQLASMATTAKAEMQADQLTVIADCGYFEGDEILACDEAGITPLVPKPLTSRAKAEGRYAKQDFVYEPGTDIYRCPAGEQLTRRFTSVEAGKTMHIYWANGCEACVQKGQCTTGKQRRIKRWEHEAIIDAMQQRLDQMPEAMRIRRSTVEHAFGTLKQWMGPNHFLTKGLKSVSAEMSLQVLAYNLKRTIGIMGVAPLVAAIRA